MPMNPYFTPGPWLIRGQIEDTSDPNYANGDLPAMGGNAGGWPYFIRQDKCHNPGETPFWIAYGIQNEADAKILAAAPDMLAALRWLRDELGDPARPKVPSVDAMAAMNDALAKVGL